MAPARFGEVAGSDLTQEPPDADEVDERELAGGPDDRDA